MDPILLAAASASTLTALLIIGVAVFWSQTSERRKRARELTVGDVASLHRSDVVSLLATLRCGRAPGPAMAHLKAELTALNVRVVRATDTELIGFFSDANASKVKGMLFTEPANMPVRIAVRATATDVGASIALQIDEDYGFQMFVGPAKTAFREKNEAAAALWLERIRGLHGVW